MRRHAPLALLIGLLAACGRNGPAPTVSLNEIGTAVAETLVAAAVYEPTETPEPPEPSNTPQPTHIRTPRPNVIPRPTSTPRPAPATTRPPTAEPAGCPSGCTFPPPGCAIKGNISVNTGEKIYHVPGQQYYDETIISPEKGERWFCTEKEARDNGWRKSQV